MRGEPVAVALAGREAAVADATGVRRIAAAELPALVAGSPETRWVWWSAALAAGPLVAAGVHVDACWDLAAVHRLIHGGRRDDPAAIEAALAGAAAPPLPEDGLTLLHRDFTTADHAPADAGDLALRALATYHRQRTVLLARPDPRAAPTGTPLGILTAQAESAAALLSAELEHHGLPLDRAIAEQLLEEAVGPPGGSAATRDAEVLRHFQGTADLRNPLAVRELLGRNGFDVPDTRSWRLEPLRASPGIAALLAWRKVERIATTYGYSWLSAHVRGNRLRGQWIASDGAGGRMTASAGLHNLPAELRGCVVADPGHVLIRADLGQIEPRVLAVVSGDPGLIAATRDDDMYAPVARALGVDRPTAKIAVLAAMYGQTSGPAGAALARMERAYPRAIARLQAAEDAGRAGVDVQTWGGRAVRMGGPAGTDGDSPADRSRGRYARNAIIQGAAAEFFKAWAATVRAGLPPFQGRIVLCLHDELLVQVPAAQAVPVAELVRTAVQRTAGWWAAGSGARFSAVVTEGHSWADAKD